MSCTVTAGTAVSLRQAARAVEYGPAEHGEDGGGDDEADEPGAAEDSVFWSFRAAREEDGEDDEDGDRADVDENLRKAGELGVEREKQERQSGEGDGEGEGAVDGVLEQHGGESAGDGRAARR